MATALCSPLSAGDSAPIGAVAGFCALAGTLIALVAIERDGFAPPLSVAWSAPPSLELSSSLPEWPDRRWTHVAGTVIGIAVAGVLIVATRTGRSTHEVRDISVVAAAPVLLPVVPALGWLGPAYVGEGLATAAVAMLVVGGLRHGRKALSPDADRGVLCLALAAGVVVATVVAVALGAGVGT